VKDAFLGSDICHAFFTFLPKVGEDLKQAFELSKLSLQMDAVIDKLRRRTKC
jgi:hypothetical protein